MKRNLYKLFWSFQWLVFFALLSTPFIKSGLEESAQVDSSVALVMEDCELPFIETMDLSADSVCPGTQVFLTINGDLKDAENWFWYVDQCGTEFPFAVGSLITVHPDSTMTFFVRGEGNCAGNNLECVSITLTVIDTIAPQISCIGNQDGFVDEDCKFVVPDYTDFILAVDNCVDPKLTQIPAPGTEVTENTEITVIAEDDFNNSDTCTFQLLLRDAFPPTANCKDITVALDPQDGTALVTSSMIDDGSFDACGDIKLRIDRNEFGCNDIGRQEVVLTVEDKTGQVSFCDAVVTIVDETLPDADCAPVEVSLGASGTATLTVDDLGIITNDNCGVDLIEAPETTFDCNSLDTQEIEVTITDFAGNQAFCTTQVVVLDEEAPNVIAQDLTLALDDAGKVTISTQQVNNGSTDNCTLDTLWLDKYEFDCLNLGGNTLTLFGRDGSGNEAQATLNLTIEDNTLPVLDCGEDRTIELGNNCLAALPDFTGEIIATDNCAGLSNLQQLPAIGTEISETTTIIITTEDVSGNEGQCTFQVNVVDNTAPSISCPPNQIAVAQQNCQTNLGDYRSLPVFSDNCGLADLNIQQSPAIGTIISQNTTVEITVTDLAGNENACSFEVLFTDSSTPEVTCLGDQTIFFGDNCEAILPDFTGGIQFSDECNDNISIDQFPLPGFAVSSSIEIEVAVTDQSGNFTSCFFNVNPIDTTPPAINCSRVVFVEIDENGQAELSPSILAETASDNCELSSLSVDYSTFDCTKIGYNAVPLVATDAAGNESSCLLTVGVRASLDCPLPSIFNSDENILGKEDGPDGIEVDAPCTCLGNGQFAEEIVIGPTRKGLQWKVKTTDLVYQNSLSPILAGTDFTEVAFGPDSSLYMLKGVHMDGQGYDLIAESSFYPGRMLDISNTCYYPNPQILDLEGPYCLSEAPIELKGTVGEGVEGSGTFRINGEIATFFDPAALGSGNHFVEFTWDAGSTAGELQPGDIGCIESITRVIQVAQTSPNFACNDLVRVTADDVCEAFVTPQMVLSGQYPCYDDYQVRIFRDRNEGYLPNPIPAQYFGQILNVIIEHVPSGRFCEGQIVMEDKVDPVIDCPGEDFEFVCTDFDSIFNQEDAFEAIGFDLINDIQDACQERFNITVNWTDQFFESSDECLDFGRITRTISAVDAAGNVAERCEINFLLKKPALQTDLIEQPFHFDACGDVTIPLDNNGMPDPRVTGSPFYINGFGDTVFVYNQTICNLFVAYNDNRLDACGNSYEIIRTWEYADWCDPTNIITVEQIIRIVDQSLPVVIVPTDTLEQSTGPFGCAAAFRIPAPSVEDCNTTDYSVIIESVVPATDQFGIIIPGIFDTIPLNTSITGNSGFGYYGANVPIGFHFITYKATDDCGNTSLPTRRPLVVKDKVAPVAICGDDINFSLGGNGIGMLLPEDVDEGSRDNCGPVTIKVRRVIEEACLEAYVADIIGRQILGSVTLDDLEQIGNSLYYDGEVVITIEDGKYLSKYSDEVYFTCCDGGKTITVQMQVTDVAGNTNFCWINVTVEDKLDPNIIPPDPVTLNCEDFLFKVTNPNDTLELQEEFGNALASDNCSAVSIELDPVVSINSCGVGTIIRKFRAFDKSGNSSGIVQQLIEIVPFNNYEIKFPADADAVECGQFEADTLEYQELGCDNLAINVSDDRFVASGQECYKIFRTYQIINWCEYDGISDPITIGRDENGDNIPGEEIFLLRRNDRVYLDNNNDETDGFIKEVTSLGYWRYVQMINVYDDTPATIAFEASEPFCSNDDTCEGIVDLTFSISDICSTEGLSVEVLLDLDADGEGLVNQNENLFSEGLNYIYSADAPIGQHALIIRVTDGCGNISTEQIPFEVVDCKVASPICQGISVEMMSVVQNGEAFGIAAVPASALVTSVDTANDCSGPIRFSVHRMGETVIDPTQDTLIFTCDDTLNTTIPVLVYVWDSAYNPNAVQPDGTIGGPNYRVCETFVILQDNQFLLCRKQTFSNINGAIMTEEGSPIEGVMVQLSGEFSDSSTTDIDGNYLFDELETAYDYSVKPELNHDYLNGVSTIDLVLISKHILGVKQFDSPYKLIAADANNSASVTTFDIIILRKLILSLETELSNNTSWRFIDAEHQFANASNPWLIPLKEVVSLNNLAEEEVNQNFIGVKIGDVNTNAQTSNLIHSERSNPVLDITLENQEMMAGEIYEVSFALDQMDEVLGYQYTLDFDPDQIELLDINYGLAGQGNFRLDLVADGLIATSWNAPEKVENTNQELYRLTFKANATTLLSNVLKISSRVTKAEAYDLQLETYTPRLVFKGQQITDNSEIFSVSQNYPNPFTTQTQIDFTLPKGGEVQLTIFNASGGVVQRVSNYYEAGKHIIQLNGENLPKGVLYFSLQSGEYHSMKKMIALE